MTLKHLRVVMLTIIVGLSLTSLASCSNSAEPKKAEPEQAEKVAQVQEEKTENKTPSEWTPEQQKIIDDVKDTFICTRSNLSIKEAEEQGALCQNGKQMMDVVEKMLAGGISGEDIMFVVQNHRIQGKAIAVKNGNDACLSDGKLNLDFFIMSYCPFGVKYVDQILHPMINDFGDELAWNPRYIMSKSADGKLSSMHGQKEVDENLRQICIRDKWGAKPWLSYMDCFSPEIYYKERSGNAKDWKFCAEQVGIDPAEIQKCFDTEAVGLADKDVELSMKYGASGSPTAVYNCNTNIVGAIPYTQVKPHICKVAEGTKTCAN